MPTPRLITATTPLGDELMLRRVTGRERIGRPFLYVAEFLSRNPSLELSSMIGEPVTIHLEAERMGGRYFHGLVSSFTFKGWDGGFASYEAELRPWLWFLTRTSNCRIFPDRAQAETIRTNEVILEIFRLNGFSDFEDSMTGEFQEWDHCVQYRETDFNFVSRLMEHEGIYYYFRHEDGKHTMVLCNDLSGHEAMPGYESVPFRARGGATSAADEHISTWSLSQRAQPGAFSARDYNFENPPTYETDLEKSTTDAAEHEHADMEIFDYPGDYQEGPDGDRIVEHRMQELKAQYELIKGDSNARGIAVGSLMTVTEHEREDQNKELLILATDIELQNQEFESGGAASSTPPFHCVFQAMDSSVQYRPPRVTQRPVVQGPQTAIVVGGGDDDIWTDEYGRVKVKFFWDRHNAEGEFASCWLRVSQNWAGAQWGGMYIPHVGQEVIVEFLEGDPNRPLVTGRVYNRDNPVPEELPANRTKSVLRDYGWNETIMEGRDGEQFIHTKQRCGNEMKFDGTLGAEKIEIRDKYGNEMIFDAVAGTITIHSPTHESVMILGKSVEIKSLSDLREYFKGNYDGDIAGKAKMKIGLDLTEMFMGAQHKTTIGVTSKFIGGWKRESILGAETKTIRGAKKEVIKGAVYKEHIGLEYKAEKGGRKAKAPSAWTMVKEAKFQYDNAKSVIDANREIEIQGKNIEKIGEDMRKFKEAVWEAEDTAEMKANLLKYVVHADYKLKAAKRIEDLTSVVTKANEQTLKGEIKLG